MRSSFWTLAMMLTAPAAAQGITVAEGDNLQSLTIRVIDENDLTASVTVLENLEFLDIEITGRLAGQELDSSRSRRLVENGMSRVELRSAGRLMRYRRNGGQQHGFLWIPAHGIANVVLEQPGTGTSGLESPFADRIAVSADGRWAAVPLRAGGLELFDLRAGMRRPNAAFSAAMASRPVDGVAFLGGTPGPDTSALHRFVPTSSPVVPMSLMLGTHAFFQTDNGRLWRLSLADGSVPDDVSPPLVAGSFLEPELAMSDDGSTVVFLYGPDERQSLFVLRGTGPATLLPPAPGKIENPGYLPEDPGHAELLLNGDGTKLLYSDRDEISLLDLPMATSNHLTSDENFEPTIGVAILPFFSGGTLLVAIGDDQRMDWFIADATPGTIENLTLTGPQNRPFAEGVLDPRNAVLTPSSLLVTETVPTGGMCLRSITAATPQGEILYDGLLGDMIPGSQFAGANNFLLNTASGDRLINGITGEALVSVPAGIHLSPLARGPTGQLSVFRASLDNGLGTAVFRLPNGVLINTPAELGLKQAVLTAGGGVVLNGDTLRYVRPRVLTVIPTSGAAVTLVLSGAGS